MSEEKKQQVLALGRLGWSLRRIERAVRIRRETVSTYLKAAGVPVRPPGGWGRGHPKPAIGVSTDPGHEDGLTDQAQRPETTSSASVCEPYREFIEAELAKGRNAMAIWQDLISDHGFAGSYQTVKRFARNLRGPQGPEAAGIIFTAAGEGAASTFFAPVEGGASSFFAPVGGVGKKKFSSSTSCCPVWTWRRGS